MKQTPYTHRFCIQSASCPVGVRMPDAHSEFLEVAL